MINNSTARRIRWWDRGAGLVGAALLTAAVVGVSTADTDRPTLMAAVSTPVDLTATTLLPGLLDSAFANFTESNELMSQLNLADFPGYAGFVALQLGIQHSALSSITTLQASEELISQYAAPFGPLTDLWFTLVNLGWYIDSYSTLALNQVLDNALTNGSLGAASLANLGLHVVDFGIFGDAIASFSVNVLAAFF